MWWKFELVVVEGGSTHCSLLSKLNSSSSLKYFLSSLLSSLVPHLYHSSSSLDLVGKVPYAGTFGFWWRVWRSRSGVSSDHCYVMGMTGSTDGLLGLGLTFYLIFSISFLIHVACNINSFCFSALCGLIYSSYIILVFGRLCGLSRPSYRRSLSLLEPPWLKSSYQSKKSGLSMRTYV